MAKRIAVVCTVYQPKAHADVIVSKFLRGFPTDDGIIAPKVKIVTMYIDQPGGFPSSLPTPVEDLPMGIRMAEKYGVTLVNSIRAALCMRPDGSLPPATGPGADEVTVDGVLAIGEHGDYPWNSMDQHLYPRRHFFEQICGVLSKSPRRHEIPIFTDKFLANSWEDALWVYETGKSLGLIHMAGSSVPNCFHRDPWLQHPIGTDIEDAVMLSYGGLESYGYHGLEALQAMVERRRGGEAGIAAVQCLEGASIWEAAEAGKWDPTLAQAALEVVELRQPTSMAGASGPPPTQLPPLREAVGCGAALFLLECADGFRCALLHAQDAPNFELEGRAGTAQSVVAGWAYADRVNGQVQATAYNGNEAPNHPPFSYLSLNIEQMFLTGISPYPVERTLLTTGALDALMRSRHEGNVRIETSYLVIPYQPSAVDPIHPTLPRPVGASTHASPELLADHADPGVFPTEIINASTLREKAKL